MVAKLNHIRALVMTVNGGWSEYGACSVTCGEGIQTRACSNPYPRNGGATCIGASTEACSTLPCPGTMFCVKNCVDIFVELRRCADTVYGDKIESRV